MFEYVTSYNGYSFKVATFNEGSLLLDPPPASSHNSASSETYSVTSYVLIVTFSKFELCYFRIGASLFLRYVLNPSTCSHRLDQI